MFYKLLFLLLFGVQIASATVDIESNRSEDFKISGYLDGRFTEWGFYNAIPSRGFSIRRAGFELNAGLSETVSAEVKVETRPDEFFLKNAFVQWNPLDWARLKAGQFKKENLLGGSVSIWNLNMFERPLVYNLCEDLTYAGRDLGFDIRIDLPSFSGVNMRGTAGVFNGDLRGVNRADNELLYSMRGEIEIPSIDLTLGASAASHRLGRQNQEEPSGYSVSSRQNALSVDMNFGYDFSNWYGMSLKGEYCTGDNWSLVDVVAGDEAPRFTGYWGEFAFFYHPWSTRGIETVSLAVGYDHLTPGTQQEDYHNRISLTGSVYPSDNIRIRFGGVKNTTSGILAENNYTDFIAEIGLRF